MVPSQGDPIWKSFVSSDKEYAFTCLATKMMHSRIKQLVRNDGDAAHAEAIQIAQEFFVKNINICEEDFKLIQG